MKTDLAHDAPVRILMVDDDVDLLKVVRDLLQGHFHCLVDATPDPAYGFELALKTDYDLYLFDFQMPHLDGCLLYLLLSKVFLSHKPHPRKVPPLLMLSACGHHSRAREILREPGVRGLLPKPFRSEQLLSRVKESLPSLHMPG